MYIKRTHRSKTISWMTVILLGACSVLGLSLVGFLYWLGQSYDFGLDQRVSNSLYAVGISVVIFTIAVTFHHLVPAIAKPLFRLLSANLLVCVVVQIFLFTSTFDIPLTKEVIIIVIFISALLYLYQSSTNALRSKIVHYSEVTLVNCTILLPLHTLLSVFTTITSSSFNPKIILLLTTILWGSVIVLLWHYRPYIGQEDMSVETKPTRTTARHGLILMCIFVAGLAMRVYNLGYLEPYTDEYAHLVGAMGINNHGSPTFLVDGQMTEPYMRFFPLTYGIAFLFDIFGKSLVVARMPGAVFGALTTFAMYWLGKKIHPTVGLISAALWAFSPWAIATSRNVREYSFFPFFYILIGLFLFNFAQFLVKTLKQKEPTVQAKLIWYLFGFTVPFIYAFYIDPATTFKQFVLLYAGFAAFLVISILTDPEIPSLIKKGIRNISVFTLIGLILFLFVGNLSFINIIPSYSDYWLNLIFTRNSQWFFNGNIRLFFPLFFVGIFSAIYSIRQQRKTALFLFLLFFIYIYFFTFHFSRYNRPRYGFGILVWYIPLIALGVHTVLHILSKRLTGLHRYIGLIMIICVLLSVFNYKNTVRAFTLKKHGYVPITDEYHDTVKPTVTKYATILDSDTVIICTLCSFWIWHQTVDIIDNRLYTYRYTDPGRFIYIASIIDSNKYGWIVLDGRRNNRWSPGLPRETFNLGELPDLQYTSNKPIHFVEGLSGFNIYYWDAEKTNRNN